MPLEIAATYETTKGKQLYLELIHMVLELAERDMLVI